MSESINDPVNPARRSVVAGLAAGTVAAAAGLPEPCRRAEWQHGLGLAAALPEGFRKIRRLAERKGLVAARLGLAAAVVGAERRDGNDGQAGFPRAARA